MPEFEFDVDASIAAGWDRFASRLAGFLRDLVPGATFDLEVPVHGAPAGRTPSIRFTAGDPLAANSDDRLLADSPASSVAADETMIIEAEVSAGGTGDGPPPLFPGQLAQLESLGWALAGLPADKARPFLRLPAHEASHLAHLVAGTVERVFGIPHPVFLHDVINGASSVAGPAPDGAGSPAAPGLPDPAGAGSSGIPAAAGVAGAPSPGPEPGADPLAARAGDADFRPLTITDPDQATRAVAAALAEIYDGRVEADENDVFTVPAGCVVLFVRVHRSLPLIVFRSPLIPAVEDAAAAETEVAILNRDSLWCRYVFDGKTVFAESEFVDRVFVPVNFKIQLAEITAELADVYPDLARRVAGSNRRDLHSADEPDRKQQ